MITVSIFINGNPILTRSAVNQRECNDKGETKYITDCGHVLWHRRDGWAVPLAPKMLDVMRENEMEKGKK